jgi:elongation factor Ts
MAEISASMVKALREATGLGMMECKKALIDAKGDMHAAEDLLRIRGGAKASRVANRIAAEGIVSAHVSEDRKRGALVEVNCETDFVAKDENFVSFARGLAPLAAEQALADLEALLAQKLPGGESVEDKRQALVMKLGENINVRRFTRVQAEGRLAQYVHGGKIAVLVDYAGGDEALGKDLAMHIAAAKPLALSTKQIPAELISREREVYKGQAAESGKPAHIVEKMVEGRVAKYLAEVTLLGQPFVKNPDQTVGDLLASRQAKVHAFQLFVAGEGIEKKIANFAEEVRVQASQAKLAP